MALLLALLDAVADDKSFLPALDSDTLLLLRDCFTVLGAELGLPFTPALDVLLLTPLPARLYALAAGGSASFLGRAGGAPLPFTLAFLVFLVPEPALDVLGPVEPLITADRGLLPAGDASLTPRDPRAAGEGSRVPPRIACELEEDVALLFPTPRVEPADTALLACATVLLDWAGNRPAGEGSLPRCDEDGAGSTVRS